MLRRTICISRQSSSSALLPISARPGRQQRFSNVAAAAGLRRRTTVPQKPLVWDLRRQLSDGATASASSSSSFRSKDEPPNSTSTTTNNNQSSSDNDNKGNNDNDDHYISGETTHFGYEEVDVKSKQERVKQVFEGVADSYDIMNDFMSFGLHRLWKDAFVDKLALEKVQQELQVQEQHSTRTNYDDDDDSSPPPSFSILDVAGGTGDISFRMAKACPSAKITVCDINQEMLRVGKSRAAAATNSNNNLIFRQGNAQDLHEIESNQYDIYTVAFGLRNVTDVDKALREAHRVLKPGGRFLCLEFSPQLLSSGTTTSSIQQQLYNLYSFQIIPQLGKMVANDEDSYRYLVESIRKFSTPSQLQTRMEQAGMVCCTYELYTQGIVAVHEGWKSL